MESYGYPMNISCRIKQEYLRIFTKNMSFFKTYDAKSSGQDHYQKILLDEKNFCIGQPCDKIICMTF